MQESIVFLLRVQCRRKESSRSLSHLMMSFLSIQVVDENDCERVLLLKDSLNMNDHAKKNKIIIGLRRITTAVTQK